MKLKTKFQDEDFDFGEIVEGVVVECLGKHEEKIRVIATAAKGGQHTFYYSSIKKFMDDWEDAPEEPKEHWCVTMYGGITRIKDDEEPIDDLIEIGNYFSSKEDAYDAWERLKAWKRLKDKGFRFRWIDMQTGEIKYGFFLEEGQKITRDDEDDLLALFGGEE